ncbi:MAG: formate dehydrogenase subunit delta [Burkholderiaceae bacterium]
MNGDHLIQMANQIGVFFESMPERDVAIEGVATHIKKFWDPRMRRAFLELADDEATRARLSDMVQQAVRKHRGLLA